MPEISVVLCHYYLSPQELASVVNKLLRMPTLAVRRFVIVHNNQNVDFDSYKLVDSDARVSRLRGSNSLLDFSAYREGVKEIPRVDFEAGAIFLNDSAFRKLPIWWILKKISLDVAALDSIDAPIAIGFGAQYRFFLLKNPWSNSSQHLCSACFFANVSAIDLLIRKIEWVNEVTSSERQGAEESVSSEALSKLFGVKFYTYLQLLLFSGGSRVWLPEIEQSAVSVLVSKKAICFFLEHFFSAQLEIEDGGLIFVNRGKSSFFFSTRLYVSMAIWRCRMLLRRCNVASSQ